jgi:hypothetical protein
MSASTVRTTVLTAPTTTATLAFFMTTASNRYDKKRRAQHLALKDPFYKKIDAAREKKAREEVTKAKEPKATGKGSGSGSGSGSSKRSKKDKKSDKKGDKDPPEPEVCTYTLCSAI